MGISDDVIGDVSNPSLLAVTLDPTLGLRRRKGRRLSNGDFPREIPIGDVIKLLSILNPPIVYTLFAFHSNYGDILYRLRVIASYW